jgi:predicted DNA-binding transcriptional regulator AlpA
MDGEQTWTSDECAKAWGVKTPTWLGYVARGHAPQPLPGLDSRRRRRWDPDQVRNFTRPGVGRRRSGAGPEAEALLGEMREVAERMERLRARQRTLLGEGRSHGLEILAMSQALGISRQTAYGWLADADT